MGDLATLYPAILHLGGEDAGRGMGGEMGRGFVGNGNEGEDGGRKNEDGGMENGEAENKVISMTLRETVFHELETADDLLLEDLLQVIRGHRLSGRESRTTPKSTMSLIDSIAAYREEAIDEELDIDPDEIWGNVRSIATPIP